jgi:hypothetical protein
MAGPHRREGGIRNHAYMPMQTWASEVSLGYLPESVSVFAFKE